MGEIIRCANCTGDATLDCDRIFERNRRVFEDWADSGTRPYTLIEDPELTGVQYGPGEGPVMDMVAKKHAIYLRDAAELVREELGCLLTDAEMELKFNTTEPAREL